MATSANPKIANYHFTTLNPNLGVVRNRYSQDFLLADIPGLIEGSSRGLGLGLKFLRHIERTRLIVHVVDMAELGGMSSIDAIKKIEHELTSYNPALKDRIGVVVANKMDLPGAQENYKKLDEYYKGKSIKLCPVSAVTNTGLDAFLDTVFLKLQNCEPIKVFDSTYVEEIIDDHDKYTIKLIKKGYYELEGYGIKKMIGYTNIDTEKGFAFFQNYFRDKGIITALKDKGIQKGDTVSLYGLEFEYLD
jgi:GTP-binding protein